jgi:hypothetical protein
VNFIRSRPAGCLLNDPEQIAYALRARIAEKEQAGSVWALSQETQVDLSRDGIISQPQFVVRRRG